MRAASLVAAAILMAGFLVAYHPRHPFGWGSPPPAHETACTVPGGFCTPDRP